MTRSAPVALDVRLDRTSSVPLWHQLAESIETAIRSGEIDAGDRLEDEISLSRRLGLGRPTVRQAIQELVRQGLVVRKQGVGTQVVQLRRGRDYRLMSLYDDLSRAGRHPSTRLLEWATVPLDPEARGRINAAYMTVVFAVGATGSVLGSATLAHGGWPLAALVGAGLPMVALTLLLLFDRARA